MNPLFVRLFVMVATFAAVFLIAHFVMRSFTLQNVQRSAVNARLRMLRAGMSQDTVVSSLLKNAPPVLSPDAGVVERAWVHFVRNLMMAAIRIDARQFGLRMLSAFAIVAFVFLIVLLGTHVPITLGVVQLTLVLSAAVAIGAPLLYVSRKAQSRRKLMEAQFPIALDIFSRSLRAGHPVASAISLITEEMSDPIGSEFGIVSDEVAYGAELNDALSAMAERWGLEDMRMFVVCISVQSETGGNLAEIIENLSTVIRERAGLYMKVRALSSEGRMTGWMLTVLPIFTLVSMFALNPSFYLDVAQDPIFTIGFPALLCLYAVGVYSIRRLTDLKV